MLSTVREMRLARVVLEYFRRKILTNCKVTFHTNKVSDPHEKKTLGMGK